MLSTMNYTRKACTAAMPQAIITADTEDVMPDLLELLKRHQWPFIGAEGNDDDPDPDDDKSGEGDDNDDDTDDDDEDEPDDKDLGEKGKRALDRMKARVKREKAAREAAERKAKEYEDKDKSKGDQAAEKAAELEEANGALSTALTQRTIALEVAQHQGYEFKVPLKRVMRLLDLDDVEINDDGEVEGLDEALAELAEDSPEVLVKKSKRRKAKDDDEDDEDDDTDDDDDDDDDKDSRRTSRNRRRSTGGSTGKQKNGKNSKFSREKLEAQYPALRR